MSKQHYEVPVEEWNVNHFFGYMNDLSERNFGVSYAPMRSWNFERGLIGNIIGTKKKEGTHDKLLVKSFIDYTFSQYKPSTQFPAPTFGFLWTYRQTDLQRVQKDYRQKQEVVKTHEIFIEDINENLDEWFLS